jgi:hypothetical protein
MGDDSESDDDDALAAAEEVGNEEEGPVVDDYLCTWGDALGCSFDVAPYDFALLQSRKLYHRKFIYFLDGVGWVVGSFLRKSHGIDSESFRVSFDDGDISQTLHFDPDLYCAADDFSEEVEVGAWSLLIEVVKFSVGQKVCAQYLDQRNGTRVRLKPITKIALMMWSSMMMVTEKRTKNITELGRGGLRFCFMFDFY